MAQSYDHFASIWRAIDDGDINALVNNPDLPYLINDKQKGVTPLFLAIRRRQLSMVKLLLENGADPNIVCKDTTPLWLACFRGLTEIIHPLLDNGADANILCSDSSPLQVAAARGLVEVCEVLLDYPRGADINLKSERLGTALHVAVNRGHRYVMDILLKHNPDLNITNRLGETVLHIACRFEDDTIAMQLLQSGLPIDPFVREHAHNSTIAHDTSTTRVFRLLINRWPQLLHALDAYDRSPAFYAPSGIVPLLTSMTSKMVEHCGQMLYDDISYLADFQIVCRQSITSRVEINATDSADTTTKTQTDDEKIGEIAEQLSDTTISSIFTIALPCHKAMLCARSPYLRRTLQSDQPFATKTHIEMGTLKLEEYTSAAMIPVLQYIYTDELKCKNAVLNEVRDIAKRFELERLESIVLGRLGKAVERLPSKFQHDMISLLESSEHADTLIKIPDPKSRRSISNATKSPSTNSSTSTTSSNEFKTFKVHKFLLSAFSEYFRVMFSSGLLEARTGTAELQSVPIPIFEHYLYWIYSFSLPTRLSQISEQFALIDLSHSLMTQEILLPIQAKLLISLETKTWKDLQLAITESDRLNVQLVHEQCAVRLKKLNLEQSEAIKKALSKEQLDRLELMALPRLDQKKSLFSR